MSDALEFSPRPRRDPLEQAMSRHPSRVRFSQTGKALRLAQQLIDDGVPHEALVTVHGDGQNLTFDYTGKPHAAGDLACAAKVLGLLVGEYATDTADGCAAIELRAADYRDGILLTLRAVCPIEPVWPVTR